ncbi:MAG: hypothetical protein JSS27_02555 [Planctomycetes bacterium]|nr:hypothetical protein [Planctomycetota bacterium]
MILVYGSYRHALGEAALAITRETVYTAQRTPLGVRERWAVAGVLQAADAAALSTAIDALQTAYATPAQDAVLLFDDGATASSHRLITSNSLGGVQVIQPPQFPSGEGAEYTTWRSYSLVLEAMFPVADAASVLVSWEETLSFMGGGARWVYLPTLSGPPVKQQLQAQSPQRVVQSGRAVGFGGYPSPSAPLFPTNLHQESSSLSYQAPKRVGTGDSAANIEYEVRWVYEFESASALSGAPTLSP